MLSSKQRASIREATAPVNIWHGSIRSGKTIASILRWLRYVHAAPPGPLAMIGKTRDTIGRNVLDVIEQIDPRAITWQPGAPTATVMGRLVHVLGANDAKAEPKIRGITLAGAYVDEVTLVPESFWVTLLGRLSVDGAQLFGTTNPDSPNHWLKTKFLDRASTLGWRVWHFVMADNPGLSKAYIDAKAVEYTGLWHKRFILGEWVSAEGAVYDMWEPDRHVIRWDELPVMRRLFGVGLDHGTSTTSAGLLLGLGGDDSLYLVDEWRYDRALVQQSLTDAQQSAQFRDWMESRHLPGHAQEPRIEWVFLDPAAASFRAQLYHDGLRRVAAAANDVGHGIRTVASLLATDNLKIADRCAGWIAEAPGYSWDTKASERGEDKPIKTADHSLDGGRYAIASTEHLWRRHVRMAA
ncbi:PBSX family phage terminase large subunit [Haloactinopolyspora alba]|uniref:PBSX family phage terminase large subunit n=1 Tax=Haloactinopolyspora alba TaxID=648780 RepID=A0A2P8DEY6_9ACTN|nr:terminase family protein [Haloactinopolyspora alba]PSK95785.1 PBSX family phage terminase large subunit [Haloactinopolyspora alba]